MTESVATRFVGDLRQSTRSSVARRSLLFMGAIIVAETSVLFGEVSLGVSIHAFLLMLILWMILYFEDVSRVYEALLLIPLLRILNLGTGDIGISPYLWLAIVYLLLVGSSWFVMRSSDTSWSEVGVLPNVSLRWAIFVALGVGFGVGLGLVQWGFELETPPAEPTLVNTILAVLVIGLLVGFVEELIFRGLLQPWFAEVTTTWFAIIVVSVLFGFMHSVWMEPMNIVFAGSVGLLLGWAYARTRNFWFIWVVHAWINITAYAILPFMMAETPSIIWQYL